MRYYYILQFVFLLGLANALQAQDTHFSQNFANPIFLNPGITGIINGDTRVVGIYRSQWGSLVPENPFKTYLVSADMAFAAPAGATGLAWA
ncbi:MAG: type IX secretion system membrane protein PorP/SprF [Sphingobacteriales bacterium]|nr:type IX secretion system membrane protein PorP/SprF [Sphingobacteriales bacterium]